MCLIAWRRSAWSPRVFNLEPVISEVQQRRLGARV